MGTRLRLAVTQILFSCFLSAAFAGPTTLTAPKSQKLKDPIHTQADFRLHTEAHVERVKRIALWLVYQERMFEPLRNPKNHSALMDYLNHHDYSKTSVPGIMEQLYRYYGINFEPYFKAKAPGEVPDALKKVGPEFKSFQARFNKIDHDLSLDVLKKHGLARSQTQMTLEGRLIEFVTMIADMSDRPLDPVSKHFEFGREMTPLMLFSHDAVARDLGRKVSDSYFEITKGLRFEEYKRRVLKNGRAVRTVGTTNVQATQRQVCHLRSRLNLELQTH